MKTNNEIPAHVRKTLDDVTAEIATREREIFQLNNIRHGLQELYAVSVYPVETIAPTQPPKAAAAPVGHAVRSASQTQPASPPPAPTTPASLDKPTSLGAAMKSLIRTLPPFTQAQLRTALEADADFKKLLDEAYTITFYGNLAYWTKTGKLNKAGDGDSALYANVSF